MKFFPVLLPEVDLLNYLSLVFSHYLCFDAVLCCFVLFLMLKMMDLSLPEVDYQLEQRYQGPVYVRVNAVCFVLMLSALYIHAGA